MYEIGQLLIVEGYFEGDPLVRVGHGSGAFTLVCAQLMIKHLLGISCYRLAKGLELLGCESILGRLIAAGGLYYVRNESGIFIQQRITCVAVVHKHQGSVLAALVFYFVLYAH